MHVVWLAFFASSSALAQWQSSPWLHLDGAYVQRTTKEDAGPGLESTRAGVRGEMGLALGQHLAVSGAGLYHDGVGSVTNAGATTHDSGYVSDTRALLHLIYAPLVVSGGLAQYESFENLPSLYRARTSVNYEPIAATLNWGAFYVRYEQTINAKGSVSRTYSDQGGGRVDLKYGLPKARERSLEIGALLPSTKWSTHVFVNYARWTFDAPTQLNDGVAMVGPGQTVVTTVFAGLGLAF